MRPNREANAVMNAKVKPSVVVVPTCNTSLDNQFTLGGVRRSRFLRVCCDAAPCTPSRTVAWNPASKARKAWKTACGDGSCEPHRANNERSGESRLCRKNTNDAHGYVGLFRAYLSNQPTKKEIKS